MFDPTTLTHEQRARLEARFWSKVDKRGPDDCWLWTASGGVNGYGHFRVRTGSMSGAHVVAWALCRGAVQEAKYVCHACDTRYPTGDTTYRRCCNPRHLWVGTNDENMADCTTKGRRPTGERHGSKTHPESFKGNGLAHHNHGMKGESHPLSKLDDDSIRYVLRMCSEGARQSDLADELGVTKSVITKIKKRLSWKHVTL